MDRITFKIEAVRSSDPAACVVDRIEIVPKILLLVTRVRQDWW
jgi:hypothetical protein